MKPLVLGKYQLLELIAVGGMAEVFRAKSFGVEGFEKTVVIKRILPQLASHPKFVEMFVNEAKIAARLSHANIVQIFDLGVQESESGSESYFIAMEHVAGPDLAAVTRRTAKLRIPIPVPIAIYITAEVAKALDYAHRATDDTGRPLKLVHRDVSPHNILVSREGEVKLTDFGIARARGFLGGSESGVLKGKYAYMAPEQTAGTEVDHRTDLFALGIVTWELLTGRRLFKGPSVTETLAAVARATVPSVREIRPQASRELDLLLSRALAADPKQRYQSAAEMGTALESLLYDLGERPTQVDTKELLARLYGSRVGGDPNRIDVHKLLRAVEIDLSLSDGGAGESPDETSSAVGRTANARPEARSEITDDESGTVQIGSGRGIAPSSVSDARAVVLWARVAGGASAPSAGEMERARREVSRLHGWFSHSPPGEVFALFGFPRAGPFEVERATRAALGIARDPLATGLHWDVGLARVAISEDPSGGPSPAALAAAGRLAAGLSDLAADAGRGGVVVADAEAAAMGERWFRTQVLPHDLAVSMPEDPTAEAGEHTRTGMRLVVRVLGPRGANVDAATTHGRAPLVGRVGSVRSLGERLALAAEGRGQVVALVGPAGIGKTRLLEELHSAVQADHAAGWFQASCAPSLVDHPYQLVRDVVGSVAGVGPSSSPGEVFAAIDGLRPLGLSDHDVAFLASLHGDAVASRAPALPPGRPTVLGVLGALTRLSIGLSRERPLVFVLEDLQWLAPSSRDLIGLWLASLRDRPILAIVSCRPDAADDLALRGDFVRVTLRPLDDAGTMQLALGTLGTRRIPVALGRYLIEHSAGNPFFIEELLGAMLEQGMLRVEGGEVQVTGDLEGADVPSSLRGLFLARRRGMSAEATRMVTCAAVLGTRFHVDPLRIAMRMSARRATRVLEEIVRRGLLERERSGIEYRFPQDLAREVLYEELSALERMRLHGLVAARVEADSIRGAVREPPLQLADFLATHHERGPEPLRAVPFLAAAGDHFVLRRDPARALNRYRRAMVLVENAVSLSETERQARLLRLCRGLAELLPPRDQLREVLDLLERHLPRWIRADDRCLRAETLGAMARLHAMAGELDPALGRLDAAVAGLSERAGDAAWTGREVSLHATLLRQRGELRLRRGEVQDAVTDLRRALELATDAEDDAVEASVQIALARAFCAQGDFQACDEAVLRTTELASPEDGEVYVPLLLARAEGRRWRGDLEEALSCDQEALDSARAQRLERLAAVAGHRAGVDAVRLEDYGRAYAFFGSSQQLALTLGLPEIVALNRAYLGFLEIAAGRYAAGSQELRTAIDELAAHSYHQSEAEALLLLAHSESLVGEPDRARASLRNAYERAVGIGHHPLARAIEAEMARTGVDDRPGTAG